MSATVRGTQLIEGNRGWDDAEALQNEKLELVFIRGIHSRYTRTSFSCWCHGLAKLFPPFARVRRPGRSTRGVVDRSDAEEPPAAH